MAQELKACPFCGKPGEEREERGWFACSNKDCPCWHLQAELSDWNTRAQLPSQGGEAVEVVGFQWLDTPHYRKKLPVFAQNQPKQDEFRPLMTVAQHQRILAAATHPADQVEDDLTMVKVSRELLEQIAVELEHDNDRYFLGRELRALLAKP